MRILKYFVDIEISGLICVDAETEDDALEIADQLSTDNIKDLLTNYKTNIVKDEDLTTIDNKIFTEKDIHI